MYEKKELLLKCDSISMSYDRTILNNISFEIHNIVRPNITQGQVISLVGKSGIGKTQLFRILSGLQKPTSGNILIGVEQKPVNIGDVGIVPQDYLLFNHRKIYDNLKIINNTEHDKIIDYAYKFDLINVLYKYPQQLSGGQRQRVSIIQQILTGNKFILFDEPFSGLDYNMKLKTIELLKAVSVLDEMYTLIIVSHDVKSSISISDEIILLNANENGAFVKEIIDLAALGIAWTNNDDEYQKITKYIENNL